MAPSVQVAHNRLADEAVKLAAISPEADPISVSYGFAKALAKSYMKDEEPIHHVS